VYTVSLRRRRNGMPRSEMDTGWDGLGLMTL